MVLEIPEKDKMLMWSEGYIDLVIEKLPKYGQEILVNRKDKWEDTKAYYQVEKLDNIRILATVHRVVQVAGREFLQS